MPARINNDPDKYIRLVKGGRYQARPFDMGVRYTIPGTFATKDQARKAISDFWWGKIKEVPRGTRAYWFRDGVRYAVIAIEHGRIVAVTSWHPTREAAADAVPKQPPKPPKVKRPSAWYVSTVLFPGASVCTSLEECCA